MAQNPSFDSQESLPSWKVCRSSSDFGSFSSVAERVVFKSSKKTASDIVQGGITDWNLSRSSSARWRKDPSEVLPNVPENVTPKPGNKSASDLVLQSYRSLAGSKTKLERVESFPFSSGSVDTSLLLRPTESRQDIKPSYSLPGSVTKEFEPNRSRKNQPHGKDLNRTSSEGKKKENLENYPLPQSAASYYNARSTFVEISEMCESIKQLNEYLQARKTDLKAGVPGKFLHAVLGQEVADVSSIVSTILYAFYLNETLKSSELCTVPILNMKRAELNMHAELQWMLDSSYIDQSSLVFVDEIDLSYYDLFGSLKLVLLNGHKIPIKLEALKEALVEIFNCKKVLLSHSKQSYLPSCANSFYPWVESVTVGEDCSLCTLVAEKFAVTSPEILAGRGFCRLLLASILLDTGNLTNAQCTSKDKYMTTLLIKGAGRFGCNGLYQILKYKMFDVTGLKVRDILRKDFKKWTRVAGKPDTAGTRLTVSHIGMSSIGISVCELLSHEASAPEEVILFQQAEKLRLLMIVSGYYDSQKIFKREILVAADTPEHMKNFLNFFNTNASQLPLKIINQPGLREEIRAFEIDNKVTSRKTIEGLLEEYGETSNSRRG